MKKRDARQAVTLPAVGGTVARRADRDYRQSSMLLGEARAIRTRRRRGTEARSDLQRSVVGTRPRGSWERFIWPSHANPRATRSSAAMMGGVEEIEVVVAHRERATLRVGDVFLKIDADQTRTDVEVEAMAMAPIPTPRVLWRKPPVLALSAVRGTPLGRLGEPSTASAAAWVAAGAAARTLHDAPLPP